MATTSLWSIRGNVTKVIKYIKNPKKTTLPADFLPEALRASEEVETVHTLVDAINCSVKNAARDMNILKEYCGKTGDASDVVGVPHLHIEVKRVEREAVRKWIAQAIRDAEDAGQGDIPVVVHRKSSEDWLVTLRLEDFLEILKGETE